MHPEALFAWDSFAHSTVTMQVLFLTYTYLRAGEAAVAPIVFHEAAWLSRFHTDELRATRLRDKQMRLQIKTSVIKRRNIARKRDTAQGLRRCGQPLGPTHSRLWNLAAPP